MRFIEGLNLELKRQVVDDIRKTVIAFANTDGGIVYVGIEDSGEIVGIENTDNEILKLSNMIRDSVKPDITLFTSYETGELENKKIIKIIVQRGTESPYYLIGKGLRPEGVFVRQGASTVPASESAIRKMIKETDGDSYEDMRSLNQEITFEAAQREFSSRKVPFGTAQYKTLKLVNADGIYTNLAYLLSDQCVHTVKAAVFEGTDKSVFKDRHEFNGSLLQQLNEVYEYISKYNRTRAEFAGLHRIDKRDYPEDALREALLNSLVHRDYSYSASTLISIFDDRIEFISVGGLVRGISADDIMLGVSITRNENLAHIFYRLTLIEAYGTGIPKILKSYQSFPLQPKFEISENAFKITLPNKNILQERGLLSEQEQAVIGLVENKTEVTRKDVEELLKVSQTMSGRILKKLVEQGALIPVGNSKNRKYMLK
ncbi:putative DNA binding domain-containing protein [Anaerocolumna sp. AGMB13025]|uniref:RNA-binding domain-containing protein n=1 Tax=Anaerocolumna sp. AGMB13025 TaxID=3039116 RepID=UPI00241CE76D|nr:RNA-binding domain-containing protein [Anaerocolumna sp. AGMB13025]WFR58141.1 putative DNA binding domain-containing protein [Anaerocolumna sp. AGMB13025]